jgi:hypothetical protein
MSGRKYSYSRTLQGGCFVCHNNGDAAWFGQNAQGVAARHHDATGHQTWVDVMLMIRYGDEAVEQTVAVIAARTTKPSR